MSNSKTLRSILNSGGGRVSGKCSLQLLDRPGEYVVDILINRTQGPGSVEFAFWDTIAPTQETIVLLGTDTPSITVRGKFCRDGSGAEFVDASLVRYSFRLTIPDAAGRFRMSVDPTPGSVQTGSVNFEKIKLTTDAAQDDVSLPEITGNKLLVFMGQSGLTGKAATAGVKRSYGEIDGPHPRVGEISRALDKPNSYNSAAVGAIQMARVPLQHTSDIQVDPCFHAGKTMADRHPEMGNVVLQCRAVDDTGMTTGHWGTGGTEYTLATAEVTTFLAANASYSCSAIIWRGGETDAMANTASPGTKTPEAWMTDFKTMIADFRGASGVNDATCPVIIVGMSQFNIDALEGVPEYDEIQRTIHKEITNAHYLDVSDLVDTPDGRHHSAADNRIIGARIAEFLDTLTVLPEPVHRFTYDAPSTSFVDEQGVAEIYGQTIFNDAGGRGNVLHSTTAAGMETSMQLPPERWTKHLKLLRKAGGANPYHIMSGRQFGQTVGHAWGLSKIFGEKAVTTGYLTTAADSDIGLVVIDTWYDYILSWDGTDHRLYIDGVEQTLTKVGTGFEEWNLEGPQIVEVAGTTDFPTLGFVGYMDTIEIYDFAVTTEAEAHAIATKDA